MIRQLGAVLGVAVFVAIVGSPSHGAAVEAFHHGWTLAALAAAGAALASIALRAEPAKQQACSRSTREPSPLNPGAIAASPQDERWRSRLL